MSGSSELKGPDLKQGVGAKDLVDGGTLLGHADGEAVLLARSGKHVFAVAATCTHYGAPLAEGLVVGDQVHCPWHHACFSLRSGDALQAPALSPLACFDVAEQSGRLTVVGKKPVVASRTAREGGPSSVVIVGGGAAGHAAAEMLRREGHGGRIVLVSADPSPPVDRPNLSKDYLAGNAPEEWIPLRPPEFFKEHRIELVTGARVDAIEVANRRVVTSTGAAFPFDALLLATGADPVKPTLPGGDLPHVHTLRSLADSRAIIARLGATKKAVVLGASFIALEAAAALRARKVEVHVVAPDKHPLERVLGAELGDAVRKLHEEHGVVFHLERTAASIDARTVVLAGGESLDADLVVAGIGVKPQVALAEKAGLEVASGVVVDRYLQTSAPGIYAAGDIASWPDPHSGTRLRVEHWVVAQRQGQIAARNILGQKVPCALVPFFWSQHYDVQISYVGHAARWDRIDVSGSVARRDATLAYRLGEKTLAIVTIGRDLESLRAERAFEEDDVGALARFGRDA
jgi:NADPH-dependent 2,4-dienoyl-CoA reductase/sulfur reductase-like enzyme/nitrite reductase/ring-hydroxylating ferredoxin subunit